jgi:tetratricopeptide (TPR) repeat protein
LILNLKYIATLFFLFGNILAPSAIFAQEDDGVPTDDLGDVTDAFQENFYEALKQKTIENYELAIRALEKAQKASEENPDTDAIVFYEFAKNQIKLKQYDQAEINLNKVLKQLPEKMDVLETLYDLYYLKRDYDKAIPLVEKLSGIDEDYKEDLANLYHRTKQYDKSLSLLDELDESWGESSYRNALRKQIYRVTGNNAGAISNAEKKLDANPTNEREYLNLIYLYSEEGNTKMAFETAKELEKNKPKSELVHLALYKFYLDEGNTKEALTSMGKVFKSRTIEKESQYKVLGDFLKFVHSNPQYETELDTMVQVFSEENNGEVFQKIGDYYVSKDNKETALKFYEKGIAGDADNFSLLRNTILLQIDFNKFEDARKISETSLEIFPAQALLYLLNGIANNKLQDFTKAARILETGLDYLLDDTQLEKEFYEQLSNAYAGKGDAEKAAQYAKKGTAIQISN